MTKTIPVKINGIRVRRRAQAGTVRTSPDCIVPTSTIKYGFYAFIVALPFEGAIGGLFFVGLVLVALTISQPQLFLRSAPPPFWYFVTYLFVVTTFGLFWIVEAPHDTDFIRAMIRIVAQFSQLLLLFWISFNVLKSESIAKDSLLLLAISCVTLAALQVSGLVATEIGDPGEARISTFRDNPNTVASVLGVGLLSLVGWAYGRTDISRKVRVIAWLTSGCLLLAIVRTGARGNLLALMFALLVLTVKPAALLERAKTAVVSIMVIVAFVVASYQIDAVRDRWEKTFYEGDVAGRQVLLPTAWEMLLEKPFAGWGPVRHSEEMGIRTRKAVGDPHNTYLWLLLEGGLLGAVPFFIGLWLCWASAWHARYTTHGSVPLSLLFFVLAINLKGTYLFFKLFWIVLAYAVAAGTYTRFIPRGGSRLYSGNLQKRFPHIRSRACVAPGRSQPRKW